MIVQLLYDGDPGMQESPEFAEDIAEQYLQPALPERQRLLALGRAA